MNNDPRPIMPGDKVLVWDKHYDKDMTATVVCRYGSWTMSHINVCYDDYGNRYGEPDRWLYPDLVDVEFDHRKGISHGHFTNGVSVVEQVTHEV